MSCPLDFNSSKYQLYQKKSFSSDHMNGATFLLLLFWSEI